MTEEIDPPEVCSNNQFDIKTGEWIGNFYKNKDGEIEHLCASSFILWSQKDGASEIGEEVVKNELDTKTMLVKCIAFFILEHKKHWIINSRLPDNINWEEIEKAFEYRDEFSSMFEEND